MANNYTKIAELATKNQMGLSNTIKRDFGIPLDYSSVQESYEAALNYAKTSTLAYIGQPISVGDTLYVITDEAGGYLKAVGTKPTGDEKSITIGTDGKVAIKGFEAAEAATLPRKKADGTLEWLPVDSIVAGDGNTKTEVKVAEDSVITVSRTHDAATDTYTYTLDVELPTIPEYTVTKTAGTDKTTYKVTKDGAQVGEAIEVPDAYDDTSLANRVSSAEASIAEQGNSISEVKEKVDTFFAAVDAPDDVIDTLAEIQKYIADDKSGAAAMAAEIKANTDAISALTGEGNNSIDGKISTAVSAHADEADAKYATKDALAEVGAKADAAAVKTEVNAALDTKADKTALNNYYTKSETYTQTEVNELLAKLDGDSSESAASVARDLATHASENASAFSAIETKQGEQDAAIQKNKDDIAAINNDTTGILAKAKADAQEKVNALAEGAVATNTAAIAAVDAKISNTNDNITSLTSRVSALEQEDDNLAAEIAGIDSAHKTLAETVGGHTTSIKNLEDRATSIEANVASNTAKFADYSTTTQMQQAISAAISEIDYSSLEEDIQANTDAIEAEVSRAKARENEIAGLVSENTSSIEENTAEIARVNAVLTKAIDNNDAGLDSIKELASWVTEHESEVLPAIQKNTEDIAALEGKVEQAIQDAFSDIPLATALKAGLVKASDEISVGSDGAMSIVGVSTDKLVQGTLELVLDGGSAH